MALNVTADSPDRPVNARSIVQSAKSNLKIPKGFASEHIYISGEEPAACAEPTHIGKRLRFSNYVRGLHAELTFFDEGFLRIREYNRKKLTRDGMLQLRFLDPKPTVVQRAVMPSLWSAVGLAGASAVSWLVSIFTSPGGYLLAASIALATGALVAFLLFIYQSGRRNRFSTAHGGVPVLTLLASFGCFRRSRTVVGEISHAIGAAIANHSLEEEPYLRAEMQEHYRLKNEGIISPKACSKGTARILSRFG